jgi:hypothetical protein
MQYTSNPTQQSVLNRSSKDKFLLVLDLPSILKKQFKAKNLSIEPLEISVFGAVVPDINVPAVTIPYSGQNYNVSSHARPQYAPLAVNFIVDNAYANYYTMWLWLNVLNTFDESIYGGNLFDIPPNINANALKNGTLTEYQTNLTIYGLNEYNQKAIQFIYHNAFITTLGSINYSYQDATLLNSSVSFQYSEFEINILNPEIAQP